MLRFLIIIEKAGENYSAYSPDLPGCIATGSTREETEKYVRGYRDAHSRIN
jgi:predicted RNase H-like HicB family nuclease